MARYVASATGNFSTAATWDTVTNTPTIHATTDISITTAGKDTMSFTAPDLVSSVTGVAVFASTYAASGRDWTAELYLAGVGTGSIATILQTDMPVTAGWIYFRLAAPVLFTSLVANTYKWVIKSTTANSGTMAADNASTTLITILSTDDRHAAPGTADQVWICPPNCTTALTVTVDGTAGDIRGGTINSTGRRSVIHGAWIGGSLADSKAILKWDTTASATLSVTGMILVIDGGEVQMGTVATPYASSFTAQLTLRQTGGTTNGLQSYGTAKVIMQGAPRTFYATTYVSGTGITASPLVVGDAVDWNVGDQIIVTATSANATNYNETEIRFITVKNSPTSYVLSTTSGGADAAFTFTHNTNARVLLYTRNVVVTSSNATTMFFCVNNANSGYSNLDWVRITNIGQTGGTPSIDSGVFGFGVGTGANSAIDTGPRAGYVGVDYCVFDTFNSSGMNVGSSVAQTFTGNIFYAGRSTITSHGISVNSTGVGHTFVDNYFIGNAFNGINYQGVSCTFTSPTIVANNISAGSTNGGMSLIGGAPATITGANIHANRIGGVIARGAFNSVFTSCEIGTKGVNAADIFVVSATANNMYFDRCNVGSAITVSNYLNGTVGATLIKFDTLNNTTNNHRWYTEYGSAQSTGAGLSDTTVRTSGTLNVRLNPENLTTGFKYEYKILAVPSKAVFALGFIQRNAAFATDACLVELFLPGSTVADASVTMATTIGTYLPFSIAATYNGTISRYATVRISAKTTTASAYVYVADLFNGTNNITNFNTWFEGQPSSIMFEQLGDAAAVWAVPTSTLTVSGTIGNFITKLLTVAKFLGLK